MAESMLKLIKPDGKIIIEVQYLLRTISDLTFDNLSWTYKLLVFDNAN